MKYDTMMRMMAYCKALFIYLSTEYGRNHNKTLSGYPIAKPRLKSGTS
jgi:hypothetical protein